MITVKCQYTGIEFEANSKRQKNHPAISQLLNDAAKNGTYGTVVNRLTEARKTGACRTVDEYIAFAQAGAEEYKRRRSEEHDRRRQEERERDEARRQRRDTNSHLYAHGYRWSSGYAGELGQNEAGEPSREWTLYSPDGRSVTVAEALEEIERGMEVVLAERMAAIETEAYAEAEQRQAAADYDAAETAARAEAEAIGPEVEPFRTDTSDFITVASGSRHHDSGYVRSFWLRVGEINGIRCAVFSRHSGGHDFNEHHNYYCADPSPAGFKPVGPKSTVDLFFDL